MSSNAKIYVGNLSWTTTDDSLRHAFSAYGQVLDCIVMRDRDTGRSRGFGFVTYSTSQEADAAIAQFNEQELDGRRIKVNFANARTGLLLHTATDDDDNDEQSVSFSRQQARRPPSSSSPISPLAHVRLPAPITLFAPIPSKPPF